MKTKDKKRIEKHHKKAKRINLLLRMVDLNVPNNVCWTIYQTMKCYQKMGGSFSIKEASKIIARQEEVFKTTTEQEPIKPQGDAKTTTKRKHAK